MLITKPLYQVFKAIKMEYWNNYASDCSDNESLEYLSTVSGVNDPEAEIYDPNKLSIIQTGTALRIIKFQINMTAETYVAQPIIRKKAVLETRIEIVNSTVEENITEVIQRIETSVKEIGNCK